MPNIINDLLRNLLNDLSSDRIKHIPLDNLITSISTTLQHIITHNNNIESQLQHYEHKERLYIKQLLQHRLQREAYESKINDYITLEHEYAEMKTKFKYKHGEFLQNERKDNEIQILHIENSKLKSVLTQYEQTIKEQTKVIVNKDNEINNLKMKLEIKRNEYNNLLMSNNMNTSLEYKSPTNCNSSNNCHKMFNNYTDSPQVNLNCGVNVSLKKIHSMHNMLPNTNTNNNNINVNVLLNQTSSSLLNRNNTHIKFVPIDNTYHFKNATSLSSTTRRHEFITKYILHNNSTTNTSSHALNHHNHNHNHPLLIKHHYHLSSNNNNKKHYKKIN